MNNLYFNDLKSDLLFKYIFGENIEVSKKLLKVMIEGVTNLKVKELTTEHSELFTDLTNDANELLHIQVRDENGNTINVENQGYRLDQSYTSQAFWYGYEVNHQVMFENYTGHFEHRPIQIIIHNEKNPFGDGPVRLLRMTSKTGEICPLFILEMYHVYIQNFDKFDPSDPFKSVLYFLNHPEEGEQLKQSSEVVAMILDRINRFNKHSDLVKLAYLRMEAQKQWKMKESKKENDVLEFSN